MKNKYLRARIAEGPIIERVAVIEIAILTIYGTQSTQALIIGISVLTVYKDETYSSYHSYCRFNNLWCAKGTRSYYRVDPRYSDCFINGLWTGSGKGLIIVNAILTAAECSGTPTTSSFETFAGIRLDGRIEGLSKNFEKNYQKLFKNN